MILSKDFSYETATTPPLTFKALDLCDGCGAGLEPGERLAGLCVACLDLVVHGDTEYADTTELRR